MQESLGIHSLKGNYRYTTAGFSMKPETEGQA